MQRSIPFMSIFTIGAIFGALAIYSFAQNQDSTDKMKAKFVNEMNIRLACSDLAMRQCGACHCQ